MFNQDKQFRRPDGTPYDPSSFNIRQFEEHYGPGGVPEGWSMAAITPVQSPALITGVAVFTALLSGGMQAVGILVVAQGGELRTALLGLGVGAGGLMMSAFAFRTAVKRRRWLREREKRNGQGN